MAGDECDVVGGAERREALIARIKEGLGALGSGPGHRSADEWADELADGLAGDWWDEAWLLEEIPNPVRRR